MKLWHCHNTRSLRPLWALEEIGIAYEIELLPFPPRVMQRDYLNVNAMGTLPYLTDGATQMSESSAICQYLADRYGKKVAISADHPEYGSYLNWLHFSEATLTYPQTLVLRYERLEPQERAVPQIVEDYKRVFFARLKHLNAHLLERDFLCDGRFTIADVSVGYALHLGSCIGLDKHYSPEVISYLDRLRERPAFKRAYSVGEEMNPFVFE